MSHRTVEDLDHEELATLVKEHLLGGHLIDRAGMPVVTVHGVEVMRDIAIDEWMGASPIYTKRTQRLLGFEGDTVEACFKAMQLEIGAPPEFMDFRYAVQDDHHGTFHLDHCGALMDVEPMGEDFVVAMCHHIEDPTFDATGWATNPHLRMRPVHRPPRTPADRHPHCAWTVTIDEAQEPNPRPAQLDRMEATLLARLPLTTIEGPDGEPDGALDYAAPLDADLQLRDFATPVLRAMAQEVPIQAHLLVVSFGLAVEDRYGRAAAVDAVHKQMAGTAGVVAGRLKQAFGLGTSADDLATVLSLHPAFLPSSYVAWDVTVDGDEVHLQLGACPGREEDLVSWVTVLADGHDAALSTIAAAVDPTWQVRPTGEPGRWTATPDGAPAREAGEVTLVKISTGADFRFER